MCTNHLPSCHWSLSHTQLHTWRADMNPPPPSPNFLPLLLLLTLLPGNRSFHPMRSSPPLSYHSAEAPCVPACTPESSSFIFVLICLRLCVCICVIQVPTHRLPSTHFDLRDVASPHLSQLLDAGWQNGRGSTS